MGTGCDEENGAQYEQWKISGIVGDRVGLEAGGLIARLAEQHRAVNLSQGFPDFDCDPALVEDLDKAAEAGAASRLFNTGQACIAASMMLLSFSGEAPSRAWMDKPSRTVV